MQKTFFNKNYEQAVNAAWPEFIARVKALAAEQSELWLALAGGNSLKPFYQHFLAKAGDISADIWPKLRFSLADERLVPLTDPESNYKQLLEQLFQPLYQRGYIDLCQTYPINFYAPDVAAEYTSRTKQPTVALLGVGEDGHIASLFPGQIGHAAVEPELVSAPNSGGESAPDPDADADTGPNTDTAPSPGFKSTPAQFSYRKITNSPKPPAERISLSPDSVKAVDTTILCFAGPAKQQAYDNFLNPKITISQCPAKLSTSSPHLYLITDLRPSSV